MPTGLFLLNLRKQRNSHMEVALKNIVWQEGKFFVAQCLNVEVSSFGDTKEEALANLAEATELYFEDMPVDQIQTVENPEIVTTSLDHG
jgi:predicted RNase H-like HicB family nuclease